MAQLGTDMRKLFLLSPEEAIFLNHGSYGAVPKCVQEQRFRYLEEMEAQPDVWCRKRHIALWRENRDKVAKFVGAEPQNLVFVNNATAGVNTILKSIDFQPGDAILTYTYTYAAVRNACVYTARRTGAEVLTLDFRPPITSTDQVIEMYEKFLKEHKNIKLVVLEYISSMPSLMLPLDRLIPLFRKHGVLTLIDGAHTPGQLKLNLEELRADFYTGNLHKWGFAPRGCALLWVAPSHKAIIRPLVISSFLDNEESLMDFMWQGTVDHTMYFCAGAGIDFINEQIGGQDTYIKYCSELADKAADFLVTKFGTRKFEIPRDMESPFLRMILIPPLPGISIPEEDRSDPRTAFGDIDLIQPFWDKYKIQSVFTYIHGEPYIRISCNVYNTIEDYEKLAECLLNFIAAKSK